MARKRLASGSSKVGKRARGRTTLERIPVTIRSSEPLGDGFEQRIRIQLAARIEHGARLIERITVRFEDVNGPKGGVDIVCRVKIVLSGRPSIVIEKRAHSHALAFARAARAIGTAFERARRKHGLATRHVGRRVKPVRRPTESRVGGATRTHRGG